MRTVAISLISCRAQLPRPFAFHPHLKHPPHGQSEEADEDMRVDPLGLLVEDRA